MDFVDTTQVDHTPVALVDRAGEIPYEFRFDGRAWVKPEGKTTWNLPAYVACWLLKGDRCKVWTTDGTRRHYVRRFRLDQNEDAVQADMIARVGSSVEDITPITIDTHAIEGWSLEGADPRDRRGTEIRQVRGGTLAQRERIGGAAAVAFRP